MNLLIGYLFLELIIVGIIDYKIKKISNIWIIIHLFLFVVLWFATDFYMVKSLYYPLIILIVTFFLFALRIMGAGDGKYLTTFTMLIPKENGQVLFLIYLMIVIIAATLPSVIYSIKHKERFKKKAFAPIIFIAWMFYVITIMVKAP